MSLPPLHLGLTPWDFSELTAQALGRQAQFAEALGYESFWLPENHFGEGALPDPLTLLASVATVTERMALATTSYLLPLRNPLQAAEQVAVLDQLSNGRVILGIGRGYAPEMLKAFHVPPSEKRRIFAWALELMRAAWAGERVSLDGNPEHAVTVYPRPVQRPEPLLWVAAFGPKALTQAGRLGLPYLSSPLESIVTLQRNLDVHRQAAVDADVAIPKDVPLMRTTFVSKDEKLLERVRAELAASTVNPRSEEDVMLDDWAIVGTPDFVGEQIQRYRAELGMTHMVATRLRIGGLDDATLRESLTLLAGLLADG